MRSRALLISETWIMSRTVLSAPDSSAAKAMIDQLRQQSTPLGFSHRQNRGDWLLNRIVLDG